tara:strand:+ start:231 stop:599 length:369 start_codon:yes stop_codon:yes gene_type:complete
MKVKMQLLPVINTIMAAMIVLLSVATFASVSTTVESFQQDTAINSNIMLNEQHAATQGLDLNCDSHDHTNNCHSGVHHCGLVAVELKTPIFNHTPLTFHYDFYLEAIFLDVPLPPPRKKHSI